MSNKLFIFGKITAEKAITMLFYIGLFPTLAKAYAIGKQIYLTTARDKMITYIQNGQEWHTSVPSHNGALGVMGGIAAFIVMGLLWKIICELLIMIFRCFETYVRKNDY